MIENDDLEHVFIKTDSKLVQLKFNDILWVEALGNYVRVHTLEEKHTVLTTMKELEAKLPNKDFLRVQRSFIVRLDQIKSIEDNYIIINDKEIHIGKSYKDMLSALKEELQPQKESILERMNRKIKENKNG